MRPTSTRENNIFVTAMRNWNFKFLQAVYYSSNYKLYANIVKHKYVLGGMVFTICKAQLHVSATNIGHLQVVQWKLINQLYMHL